MGGIRRLYRKATLIPIDDNSPDLIWPGLLHFLPSSSSGVCPSWQVDVDSMTQAALDLFGVRA
jgi:hypothetical protein